jgi:hypothetical protein
MKENRMAELTPTLAPKFLNYGAAIDTPCRAV